MSYYSFSHLRTLHPFMHQYRTYDHLNYWMLHNSIHTISYGIHDTTAIHTISYGIHPPLLLINTEHIVPSILYQVWACAGRCYKCSNTWGWIVDDNLTVCVNIGRAYILQQFEITLRKGLKWRFGHVSCGECWPMYKETVMWFVRQKGCKVTLVDAISLKISMKWQYY